MRLIIFLVSSLVLFYEVILCYVIQNSAIQEIL